MATKEIIIKDFTVLVAFTYDRDYLVGQTIQLSDETTIEKLIENKFIKWQSNHK